MVTNSGGGLFYLYPVAGDRVAGLGAHIAFAADTREAVDEAYAAALAAGAHPDIAPDYYGCVLFDLDSNKLEIIAGAMH